MIHRGEMYAVDVILETDMLSKTAHVSNNRHTSDINTET